MWKRLVAKGSRAAIGGLVALSFAATAAVPAQDRLTVFAAASLKNALDAVNAVCAADMGAPATVSYAASSALARQIEAGAPADIFMPADLDWMAYLSGKGLIKAGTETRLLGNSMVLVAPADSKLEASIAPNFDLAGMLGNGRLAMANVDAVPAGRYGKAALQRLGVWTSVEDRVAQAENVRAALALVSFGEAPLGIVYRTDAAADPKVRVIAVFPEDSHPPIVYPVAEAAGSNDPRAPAFMRCLRSPRASALFEAQGFTVLAPTVPD